jgi:NADH:ubiquinone oxidoreductase subunit D
MAVRPKLIGTASSTEAQYLYEITKQLARITNILLVIKDNTGGITTTTTTTVP